MATAPPPATGLAICSGRGALNPPDASAAGAGAPGTIRVFASGLLARLVLLPGPAASRSRTLMERRSCRVLNGKALPIQLLPIQPLPIQLLPLQLATNSAVSGRCLERGQGIVDWRQ